MLRPMRIRHYLAVMRARGFSAESVLRGTGIDPLRLQDQRYLVDPEQCARVIANILELSGDPGIGLEIGAHVAAPDLGIVGYAVMSCRTMRQTLSLWTEYSASLAGIPSKLSVAEVPQGLEVKVIEPAANDPIFVFCAEEILAMMYTFGGILADSQPVVTNVWFSYPAPSYVARYRNVFRCPVEFGAQSTGAVVAKEWLDKPLRNNDEEFNQICLQHCGQILHQIEDSSPLISKLRSMLLRNPRGVPKLDEIARELGMSARTLRRHLHEEGTSYQDLVDTFRADLAREYMGSGRMSPKEVAYLLGFQDPSAFRRAFKLWTGQTTREYRSSAVLRTPDFRVARESR